MLVAGRAPRERPRILVEAGLEQRAFVISRAGEPAPNRAVDAFLGGRLRLVQPSKGHRAGLDAALLQALVPAGNRGPRG